MTRKRFKKLVMAHLLTRNDAEIIADMVYPKFDYESYDDAFEGELLNLFLECLARAGKCVRKQDFKMSGGDDL